MWIHIMRDSEIIGFDISEVSTFNVQKNHIRPHGSETFSPHDLYSFAWWFKDGTNDKISLRSDISHDAIRKILIYFGCIEPNDELRREMLLGGTFIIDDTTDGINFFE